MPFNLRSESSGSGSASSAPWTPSVEGGCLKRLMTFAHPVGLASILIQTEKSTTSRPPASGSARLPNVWNSRPDATQRIDIIPSGRGLLIRSPFAYDPTPNGAALGPAAAVQSAKLQHAERNLAEGATRHDDHILARGRRPVPCGWVVGRRVSPRSACCAVCGVHVAPRPSACLVCIAIAIRRLQFFLQVYISLPINTCTVCPTRGAHPPPSCWLLGAVPRSSFVWTFFFSFFSCAHSEPPFFRRLDFLSLRLAARLFFFFQLKGRGVL